MEKLIKVIVMIVNIVLLILLFIIPGSGFFLGLLYCDRKNFKSVLKGNKFLFKYFAELRRRYASGKR